MSEEYCHYLQASQLRGHPKACSTVKYKIISIHKHAQLEGNRDTKAYLKAPLCNAKVCNIPNHIIALSNEAMSKSCICSIKASSLPMQVETHSSTRETCMYYVCSYYF